MRLSIVRYYLSNHRNWGRIPIKMLDPQRHPIPRPNGRAMGCLVNVSEKIHSVIMVLHCMYIVQDDACATVIFLNHGWVSMVVADGLAPICPQGICNLHDDVGWSVQLIVSNPMLKLRIKIIYILIYKCISIMFWSSVEICKMPMLHIGKSIWACGNVAS